MENALNLEQQLFDLRSEFEDFKKVVYLRDYYTHGGYKVDKPCMFDQFESTKGTILGLACPCPKCSPQC